jgi:hypothetical protein
MLTHKHHFLLCLMKISLGIGLGGCHRPSVMQLNVASAPAPIALDQEVGGAAGERIRTAMAARDAAELWNAVTGEQDSFDLDSAPQILGVARTEHAEVILIETNRAESRYRWVLAQFNAQSQVSTLGPITTVRPPSLHKDGAGHLKFITYEDRSTGTGVAFNEFNVLCLDDGPPGRDTDRITFVFRGPSTGYAGEWFSAKLMRILFGAQYTPTPDRQLVWFDLAYRLERGEAEEWLLHRHGRIRLSTYELEDVHFDQPPVAGQMDATVSEYLRWDPKLRCFVPAI